MLDRPDAASEARACATSNLCVARVDAYPCMPFGMKVVAAIASPWKIWSTKALRSMAWAIAWRSLTLSRGGELTRKTSQNTVRLGVFTTWWPSVLSWDTDAACAGCTVTTSRSPLLYLLSAAAPSWTIAKSIRVRAGFGPQ